MYEVVRRPVSRRLALRAQRPRESFVSIVIVLPRPCAGLCMPATSSVGDNRNRDDLRADAIEGQDGRLARERSVRPERVGADVL